MINLGMVLMLDTKRLVQISGKLAEPWTSFIHKSQRLHTVASRRCTGYLEIAQVLELERLDSRIADDCTKAAEEFIAVLLEHHEALSPALAAGILKSNGYVIEKR